MGQPSQETLEVLGWIKTEIRCGMVLIPLTEQDRIWNNAHERALAVLASYRDGAGLFQMIRKREAEAKQPKHPQVQEE